MPDIVLDYELLHRLGRDIETLKHRIEESNAGHRDFGWWEVGPGVAQTLDGYRRGWKNAFKNATELLESLSGTYTAVAQQWFDQDASYAAIANEQAAGFTHSMWLTKKMSYDTWERLSHTYQAVTMYDDDGNPYLMGVPLADPHKPPPEPGAEPSGYSYTAPDGSKHETTSAYNPDGSLHSNETSISNGDGTLQYHEKTTFGEHGSYESVVKHPDGSTVQETVVGNPDGTGTKTDVVTDTSGRTDKTVYSGTGLDGDNPVWTKESGGYGHAHDDKKTTDRDGKTHTSDGTDTGANTGGTNRKL
ncbi:hypothetical protein KUM39_19060 [Streptomyces sp. J2-1]|uniref:hypothetical protein n=1 Tax=Streptomyces corallincola TaxID=2851888 RepID=UPI001C39038B|nr:hypothetical protein [Streptomyces corallincola]MBV2356452.1 hypothetical protein [Streptomyces corallincola]